MNVRPRSVERTYWSGRTGGVGGAGAEATPVRVQYTAWIAPVAVDGDRRVVAAPLVGEIHRLTKVRPPSVEAAMLLFSFSTAFVAKMPCRHPT